MNREESHFSYDVYNSIEELELADATLLKAAREVTANAYAPYSKFHVGAVAKLVNGELVSGTNQENASFPVTICAERVLLSAADSFYHNVAIDTMAISYHNLNAESNRPISPCGMCRQSLVEYEGRFKHPIRLILSGQEGKVFIIQKSSMLLPFSFKSTDLK